MGRAAFGTQLKLGDGATPTENFTTVTEVVDISGPDISVDMEDTTNHDSPNRWEEAVPTIIRSGEVTLEINYEPTDATHNAVTGLQADMVAGTLRNFQLVAPDPGQTTTEFAAYVSGFTPTYPHNGKLGASVTLKPSGEVALP